MNEITISNPNAHCVSVYLNGEYTGTVLPNSSKGLEFDLSRSNVRGQKISFVYDERAFSADIGFCKIESLALELVADRFQQMGVMAVDFFENKYSYEIFMVSMYAFGRLVEIPREMVEIVALKVVEIKNLNIDLDKKKAEILGFISSSSELKQYIQGEVSACNVKIFQALSRFKPYTVDASDFIPKHIHSRLFFNPHSANEFNIKAFRGNATGTEKRSGINNYPAAGIRLSLVEPVYGSSGKEKSEDFERVITLQGFHTPTFYSNTSSELFPPNTTRSWFITGAGYGYNILRYNKANDPAGKVVFKITAEAGINSAIFLGNTISAPNQEQSEAKSISSFRGVQPYIHGGIQARLGLPIWFTLSYQGSLLYRFTKSFSGDMPKFASLQMGLCFSIARFKRFQY